jgi:hypothetical protein
MSALLPDSCLQNIDLHRNPPLPEGDCLQLIAAAATMTPAIKPTPNTWTLRFKHHRATVLLHVDPLQKLHSVRAELLKAVWQTARDGKLNGHAIPTDANDILLARPVDINDLTAGWEQLEADDGLEEALRQADAKGKSAASASASSKASKANKDIATDSPMGAGLTDGGVVAFKFRSEMEGARDQGGVDEGVDVEAGGEELEGETLVGEPGRQAWDVVLPSMDETCGENGERVTFGLKSEE